MYDAVLTIKGYNDATKHGTILTILLVIIRELTITENIYKVDD